MPRRGYQPLAPRQAQRPENPPHWVFYKSFKRLSDEEMVGRWPGILEQLNTIYLDVVRFDAEWSIERNTQTVFAEIRELVERHVYLAGRREALRIREQSQDAVDSD